MQLIQELLYNGIQTNILLSRDSTLLGLMNIITFSPRKTSSLLVFYSFKNIPKVFFIFRTCSTWFHVNFILHPLHFVIQNNSHMKLINLLLERKVVLIYWMTNIIQSIMSLIQYQIHHLVINFQNKLRKCVDRCYQWRISNHNSRHAWWTPAPS